MLGQVLCSEEVICLKLKRPGGGDGDQKNQFRSYKEVSKLELGGR